MAELTGLRAGRRYVAGLRPDKPGDMSDALWSLVNICWAQLPDDRPTANQARAQMGAIEHTFVHLFEETHKQLWDYHQLFLDTQQQADDAHQRRYNLGTELIRVEHEKELALKAAEHQAEDWATKEVSMRPQVRNTRCCLAPLSVENVYGTAYGPRVGSFETIEKLGDREGIAHGLANAPCSTDT